MAVTPNQVSLTYKKSFDAPFVFITVEYEVSAGNLRPESTPPWLKLIKHSDDTENKKLTYKVTVDTTAARNLQAGNYSAKIELNERSYVAIFGNDYLAGPYFFDVSLKVVDTVKLSLTKQDFSFSHVVGATAPGTQFLGITTENNWSITLDKPWATVSNSNGAGNQTVFIGVNVDGLAPGIYEAGFIVDDGQTIKSGTITLLISGPSDQDDYLDLGNTGLSFSEKLGAPPVSSATVKISTSLEVDITTQTPWLSLSHSTFPEGDHNLTVSTQNTEGLAVGSYRGSFKVQSGYSTRVVSILLRIVEIVTSGIESDGFYYAKDRNVLFLSTTAENSEALLEFSAFTNNNIRSYKKRVPFFQNAAETIIGLETNTLLKPAALPEFNSGIFIPIAPIQLDVNVFDKQINSNSLTERSQFTNLNFINGQTPAVQNKLSYIPERITTTRDGIVAFSFISENQINAINITGDINQVIVVTKPAGKIFTAAVALASLNLKAQDKIQISCGPVSVEVVIRPVDQETFQLVYLNEWDCPEVINMDGTVEIVKENDSKTVTVAEAGKEISRIIEVKEPQSFRVTTGNIYSQLEADWLSRVIGSRKMWLQINGERIEVVRSFSSLSVFKTREHNRNYSLTFDAAVR
jgi:hypothetical protein